MATVPISQPLPTTPPEPIENRFRRLETIWNAETGYLSSYTDIVEHAAFKEIVGLGDSVVPLMLHDLEERPQLWVWALPAITGANPAPPEDAGNISKMSEAWLRWGRANG